METVPDIAVGMVVVVAGGLGGLLGAQLVLGRREAPLAQGQRHHAHVRTPRGDVQTHVRHVRW